MNGGFILVHKVKVECIPLSGERGQHLFWLNMMRSLATTRTDRTTLTWVPKYRHRILTGHVGHKVGNCIRANSQQKDIEIVEINIQPDHGHLLVIIPPNVSISDYRNMVKNRAAIRVFNKFKELKQHPYSGNHFWTDGYCVDTVSLDSEMIRKYVTHQENRERRMAQRSLF